MPELDFGNILDELKSQQVLRTNIEIRIQMKPHTQTDFENLESVFCHVWACGKEVRGGGGRGMP